MVENNIRTKLDPIVRTLSCLRYSTLLIFILTLSSVQLGAQSKEEIIIITTVDDIEYKGTVIDQNQYEIRLKLMNVNDTLTLDKSTIANSITNGSKRSSSLKKLKDDSRSSEDAIVTYNNVIFEGEILDCNDKEVQFIIGSINDTVSIDRTLIKDVGSAKSN